MKPDARARRRAKKIVEGIEQQMFIGIERGHPHTVWKESQQKLTAAFDEEGVEFEVLEGDEARRLFDALRDGFGLENIDTVAITTGGGTGLIGMWKAFQEMIALGWIENSLPRMIAVQAENCKPIVETWKGNQLNAKTYVGKPSVANGLAVPNPFGEDLILQVLKQSGGLPIAIPDEAMIKSVKQLARDEGLLIAPEGGALLEALLVLMRKEVISASEKIVLLNTGSAYKYLDNISDRA